MNNFSFSVMVAMIEREGDGETHRGGLSGGLPNGIRETYWRFRLDLNLQ